MPGHDRTSRPVRSAAVAALALGAMLLGASGCGGPATTGCPESTLTVFGPDRSVISLELFRALPEEEQVRRTRQSAVLLARARNVSGTQDRLTLLDQAVSADPGNADAWLDLAAILRRVAEDARTEEALDRAGKAIAHPVDPSATDLIQARARRLSLLRAWHHYDRGEWTRSYRWAKAVYDAEPGNDAARVITGLLEARLGNAGRARAIARDIRLADEYATEPAWIEACLEISRGLDREAFSFVATLIPRGVFQSECWRDMARIAERLGEWSYARRWYQESAANMPLGDVDCLGQTDHARLAPGPRASVLPVWTGMEGAYVTGSLSSYTALAYDHFKAAPDGPGRDRWAGVTVNAAGMCIRMGLDAPWARKTKGLIFAAAGETRRALVDLRRAEQEFKTLGVRDPELEAELGHQLILEEGYDEALQHLREAVDLDPDNARAWSDLGLVLVTMGDPAGGEQALSRAITLDPGLPTAWYNRGLMYMHRGDLDRAADDLGEAARLAPDNQDIARLLQQIQKKRQ